MLCSNECSFPLRSQNPLLNSNILKIDFYTVFAPFLKLLPFHKVAQKSLKMCNFYSEWDAWRNPEWQSFAITQNGYLFGARLFCLKCIFFQCYFTSIMKKYRPPTNFLWTVVHRNGSFHKMAEIHEIYIMKITSESGHEVQ